MKLSDYVADFLADVSGGTVFLITGGAIAHVVDSLGKKRDEGKVEYVCVQHEQAGAMAIEAYSRLNSGLGVMLATSGPGATNLITGMCGCWFDSIPALFVTGQVNSKESVESSASKPRQVGFQETDIVSMVKGITKYAEKVTDPMMIRSALEKAVFLARSGRPGPVLVDIPVDLQVVDINPKELHSFTPEEDVAHIDSEDDVKKSVRELARLIGESKRPIILLGSGVRLGHAEKETLACIERLGFPVVVSWGGFDILPHDHPQFVGDIGVYGSRGANFAVQNADLVLSLGSRLDTRQTGGKISTFARGAKKVMVDIDRNEITKGRGLTIDLGICADLKTFYALFNAAYADSSKTDISDWISKTKQWKQKYSSVLPEHFVSKKISPYAFMRTLSDLTPPNETIIVDEGGNLVWTMQSWKIKSGQRLISTFGNSPMGYALPAAIGASVALHKKPVICIDGDGGFQMNIQELQTVANYKLPLKIFILNNHCYGIIQQFQDAYFNSRYEATGKGYSSPDFTRVAGAYGIEAVKITSLADAKEKIAYALKSPGPILCEIEIDPQSRLNPKLEFGRPLEDMSPPLSDEEFKENMVIEPLPRNTQSGWQKA